MKKITSKLVLEKDRTHALLNDVSNCWFPESIFIQIKKEINSNQLVYELFYSNINDENGLANSFNMMTACVWYKKNFLHMTLLVVAVALLLLLMLLLLSCSCCRCCCWCGYCCWYYCCCCWGAVNISSTNYAYMLAEVS